VEFLSNFQNVKPPRKAPIDDFLSTVLETQFVFLTTKNRRLSNSDLRLSLHTMRLNLSSKGKAMCEIPQRLIYLFQTNKIQWKRFCSVFTTLKQNQKMHRCVIQLKDHSDCRVR